MAKIDAPAFNKEANKSKDDITLEMSDSKKVLYLQILNSIITIIIHFSVDKKEDEKFKSLSGLVVHAPGKYCIIISNLQ